MNGVGSFSAVESYTDAIMASEFNNWPVLLQERAFCKPVAIAEIDHSTLYAILSNNLEFRVFQHLKTPLKVETKNFNFADISGDVFFPKIGPVS